MSTMKLCPNCNTQLKESASFCTECGSKFDSVEGNPASISQTNHDTVTQSQPTSQQANISGLTPPGAVIIVSFSFLLE